MVLAVKFGDGAEKISQYVVAFYEFSDTEYRNSYCHGAISKTAHQLVERCDGWVINCTI